MAGRLLIASPEDAAEIVQEYGLAYLFANKRPR